MMNIEGFRRDEGEIVITLCLIKVNQENTVFERKQQICEHSHLYYKVIYVYITLKFCVKI